MIHELESKKIENKIIGINVRVLDDGSFVMKTDNTDYRMCKEYSFENAKELHKGMVKAIGKINKKSSHTNVLEMKKES